MTRISIPGGVAITIGALAFCLTERGEARSSGMTPASGNSLTRISTQTCGACHSGTIGGPVVSVQPGERILAPGQTTSVTVSATGGAPGTRGGFTADVKKGRLIAGPNTRTTPTGNAITHNNSGFRSWTMTYQAPTTTGTDQLFAVVNTVNGDGRTSGDQWAFHASTTTATQSSPVRFFVTAPGTTPIGKGCPDSSGNVGIYGASETPTVGNANFALEAVGLPPNARCALFLGLQNTPSVDLTGAGAPGCFLHTDIILQLFGVTSNGSIERSSGTFIIPGGIPNDPRLQGFIFRTQVAVEDVNSTNALPVIFTNGLQVKVQ